MLTRLPIPFAPGYLADTSGKIWSVMPGRCGRYREPHLIQPWEQRGYLRCTLRVGVDRRRKKAFSVADCVAAAFYGPKPAGLTVAHLSGDKSDNSLGNLAYADYREQADHKWAHGTMVCGERSNFAKISDEAWRQLLAGLALGVSKRTAADWFGISVQMINAVLSGRKRKHLGLFGPPSGTITGNHTP